jgi:hypothetical protein
MVKLYIIGSRLIAKRTTITALYLIGITLLVCSFYYVDYSRPLGGDYIEYFSRGWFIFKGLRPYVDFWAEKGPFLFMVLALWIRIFGSTFYSAVTFLVVTTILCSYLVYGLAWTLGLNRWVCLLSGFFFALFASIHQLDPDRDGITVSFASIFELLSLIMLVWGLNRKKNIYLFFSGFMFAVAVATRQTSVIFIIALIIDIIYFHGIKARKTIIKHGLIFTIGVFLSAILFLAYLFLRGANFQLMWDQLVRFNVTSARFESAGDTSRIKIWAGFITGSFILFSTASLTYILTNLAKFIKDRSISFATCVLLSLLLTHSISIVLSIEAKSYYALQLIPEASVITSLVIAEVVFSWGKDSFSTMSNQVNAKMFEFACVLIMFFIPLAHESILIYTHTEAAVVGNYLTNSSNIPGYKDDIAVAQKIQEISKNEDDRIWLFQYGHAMIYVLSNRLPAISYTYVNPLDLPGYSDDRIFNDWLVQFLQNKPKVVVISPEVEDLGIVARIRTVIATNMVKVSSESDVPEIYTWKNTIQPKP